MNDSGHICPYPLFNSPLLLAGHVLIALTCLPAMVGNALCLKALIKHRVFSNNHRLCLGAFCASAIAHVIYEFMKALVLLTVGPTSAASYLSMNLLACAAVEIPRNCATLSACGLFFLISFERYLATKYREKYDDKSWKYATTGCISVFTVAFIYTLYILHQATRYGNFKVPFCSMGYFITGHLRGIDLILLGVIFAMVITSATISVYTKRISLQKLISEFSANNASASLQSRLQLYHSVELTKAVVISVVLYCVCYLCYSISRLLMVIFFDSDFVFCNRIQLFRLAQLLASVVHLAFHPWIVIYKCKVMRSMVFHGHTAVVTTALIDDADQRIANLHVAWDHAFKRQK